MSRFLISVLHAISPRDDPFAATFPKMLLCCIVEAIWKMQGQLPPSLVLRSADSFYYHLNIGVYFQSGAKSFPLTHSLSKSLSPKYIPRYGKIHELTHLFLHSKTFTLHVRGQVWANGLVYTSIPNIWRIRFLFSRLFFPGESHLK